MLISAQDLVKKSANLYKDNFNLFFKLAFLVTIPSIITTSLVGALTAIFGRQSQEFFVTVIYGLFFIILFIISYVIGIWFSIVKVRIIAARYENKDIASISSYIHSDKKLILPVIAASILAGIAIIGGFILFIVPGIIFSVWFAFVMYAVAIDNKESVDSLSYSKSLSKGRWLAVLWRILVPISFFLVGTYLMQTPLSIVLNTFDSVIIITLVAIASFLINILFTPFLVASQVILYSNLKNTMATENSISVPNTTTDEPPF
ncbi:MAG: hypothetical protein A3F93_04870 [Candidatus Magasanikbacteria bacterium RIFCSPLOWO2_12_FULL_34_7]|nr:MAG: hypothetical protein A3F93_04870 [Candidatus Magasanikbacteria bacterium RIFCSPLOWO2_12_FULL_34_7]